MVSFTNLARDAKIRFSDLEYFGYSKMLESRDFINIDTINIANVRWDKTLNDSLVAIKENELKKWLSQVVQTDTIVIKRTNH